MRLIRQIWRISRLIAHLLRGIALCWRYFPAQGDALEPQHYHIMQRWFLQMAAILGVKLTKQGQAEPGTLLVANHISWLDIVVLGCSANVSFLSKSDVKSWPLIGLLVTRSGTLYIERGGSQTAGIAQGIAARLNRGQTIGVFPEGTTRGNGELGRFHARLFSVCTQEGYATQPAWIHYPNGDHVPYVGEQSFVSNLWAICGAKETQAVVTFLPSIKPEKESTRKSIAKEAENAIRVELRKSAQTVLSE